MGVTKALPTISPQGQGENPKLTSSLEIYKKSQALKCS